MVINEEKEEITLSFGELVDLVNNGLVSDRFLLDVEFQIGHHIKPSASTGTLRVVKTDEAGFVAKSETPRELYDRTIKEKDAVIASNEIYEELYWITNIEATYKQWCTPDLFNYFELDFKQALAEVRAAAYPILISYNESSYQGKDGEVYRVPYLTFSDKNTSDGNYLLEYPEKPMTRTYYMNNKREVHFLTGEILEKYAASQFKDMTDWHSFASKRRNELFKKKNSSMITGTFFNIKRGETVCAINSHIYSEEYIECKQFLTKKNPDWFKTWKGRERTFANTSEEEKQLIIEKGRDAIDELSRCVMDLSNLRRTVDGQISKDYHREF